MAPSDANPAPALAVRERIADHYERKSRRTDGAFSSMCLLWADKARAGHTNRLVRRVERSRRLTPNTRKATS